MAEHKTTQLLATTQLNEDDTVTSFALNSISAESTIQYPVKGPLSCNDDHCTLCDDYHPPHHAHYVMIIIHHTMHTM